MLGEVLLDRLHTGSPPTRRPSSRPGRPRSGGTCLARPCAYRPSGRSLRIADLTAGNTLVTRIELSGASARGPGAQHALLARERHLAPEARRGEPGELGDVVRGARLAVAAHDPGEAETSRRCTDRGTRRATRPARPRARSPRGTRGAGRRAAPRPPRGTPGQIPVAAPRLDRALREQHAAVALEHALHRRRRVRPVLRAAAGQPRWPCSRAARARAAAGAEAPAVEERPRGSLDRAASSTASASRGHASFAQSPKSRSVRHASARPASGSTQRNVPLRPKCPNVRGELRAPVQCGVFASRSSKPRPQSFGSCARSPARRRRARGTGRSSPRRASRARPRRLEQLARDREQLLERASTPEPGEPREREAPDRLEVLGERHLGAAADELAEHVEARVRVDALRCRAA